MRDLFFKLFEMSHFNTGIRVTPFSVPHIVYLVLIFGAVILAWRFLRAKPEATKIRALRLLCYGIAFLYLSDFFVHEFVYGGLNTDKLPFHICTVLCPLSAFAQFNRNGKRIREPVVMLAVLAPMIYICYPAAIGEGEPWCYQAIQTMFYHGILMAWGILNLALGIVKPDLRNIWKCGVLLLGIALWAKFGNILMEHNWFFLEEDALNIGLVSQGIVSKWFLMILNPVIFLLAVLVLYGVCHLLQAKAKASAAT